MALNWPIFSISPCWSQRSVIVTCVGSEESERISFLIKYRLELLHTKGKISSFWYTILFYLNYLHVHLFQETLSYTPIYPKVQKNEWCIWGGSNMALVFLQVIWMRCSKQNCIALILIMTHYNLKQKMIIMQTSVVCYFHMSYM